MDIGFDEEARAESLIGQQLGPYVLGGKVGEGGMGVVFEATHQGTRQRVAVKVLHGRVSRDGKTFHRFENEAKAIGAIKHPGLVTIHHYERLQNGLAYIAMEFLEGEALFARLERLAKAKERLPLAHALYLGRQVASVLAAAHARGIVHCDLKPDNVFLVRDPLLDFGERVKILDFGIAKFDADHGARKTTVGLVLGTPRYMSPEQCEGRDGISDKADSYALGVMLYELLSGSAPFEAESTAALLRQHMVRDPPSLAERAPGTPESVVALVARMLAKDPAERPTMAEVSQGLEQLGTTLVGMRALGRQRPSRTRVAVLGALGVLGIGAVALLVMRGRDAGPARPVPPTGQAVSRPAPAPQRDKVPEGGAAKGEAARGEAARGEAVAAAAPIGRPGRADLGRPRIKRHGLAARTAEAAASRDNGVARSEAVPPVADKPVSAPPPKPETPVAPPVERPARRVFNAFR